MPRKRDTIRPATFNPDPIHESDKEEKNKDEESDKELCELTDSASENDELEALSEHKVQHDHQYSSN